MTDTDLHTEARRRVIAFLKVLGIKDESELNSMTEHCLRKAHQRVRDAAGDELNRRALEEARRQHDRWLERNLSLAANPSAQELGRGRTAKLLGGPHVAVYDLRLDSNLTEQQQRQLRAQFPKPIPRESRLAMPTQALQFVAFGSVVDTKHHDEH